MNDLRLTSTALGEGDVRACAKLSKSMLYVTKRLYAAQNPYILMNKRSERYASHERL